MRIQNNSKGFSIVEVVLVTVVLALLAGTGWYVWSHQDGHDAKQTPIKETTAQPAKQTTIQSSGKGAEIDEGVPKIPEGFTQYISEAYGFAFAYPSPVGKIEDADKHGVESILLYAQSARVENAFVEYASSPLMVRVDKLEEFVTRAAKYGPSLEFNNGRWIVSAKDGGNVNNGGYQIGSEYKALLAAIIKGKAIYDFSYQDEGCYRSVWVFKTDEAFVSIMLPAVCADETGAIPQARLDAYKSVTGQVLKTLTIQ